MTKNNDRVLIECSNWNECNLKLSTRIHWRESLVPAAAVIPAPVAYTKVVAVKKLVVGSGVCCECCAIARRLWGAFLFGSVCLLYCECSWKKTFTVKKLECLKQAKAVNTLAWDNRIGLAPVLLV